MAGVLGRERILEQAGDLFLAHGASGVTMRGLAARMGVTPMALYRHFESRDDLLHALLEEGHATFLRYLNRALAEATPEARFVASGRQYLAFALEHPRSYAVMFMEHVPQSPDRKGPQGWLDVATFRFLVDRIRECAAAGALRTDDPEDLALTTWAHVHGLVSLFLAGKLAVDREEFERIYLRSIVAVMRAFGWRGLPEDER
jgi:AcrR family transcriptional regulator